MVPAGICHDNRFGAVGGSYWSAHYHGCADLVGFTDLLALFFHSPDIGLSDLGSQAVRTGVYHAGRISPWLFCSPSLPVRRGFWEALLRSTRSSNLPRWRLFQVIVLSILGPKAYRAILFPCLFLFFLVPVGQYLVPPLQTLTHTLFLLGLFRAGHSSLHRRQCHRAAQRTLRSGRSLRRVRFLISNIVLARCSPIRFSCADETFCLHCLPRSRCRYWEIAFVPSELS